VLENNQPGELENASTDDSDLDDSGKNICCCFSMPKLWNNLVAFLSFPDDDDDNTSVCLFCEISMKSPASIKTKEVYALFFFVTSSPSIFFFYFQDLLAIPDFGLMLVKAKLKNDPNSMDENDRNKIVNAIMRFILWHQPNKRYFCFINFTNSLAINTS
jgi:hypothetical protein